MCHDKRKGIQGIQHNVTSWNLWHLWTVNLRAEAKAWGNLCYIESSFNTRETKDQRPNLETSIKVSLKSKSSPVTTCYCLNDASCKNGNIFSLDCVCHDWSANHPVNHKCFPMITVTNQRAPSQLCTALHFVTAGEQSADNFRSNSNLQDQWAGPWTKDLKPETNNQEPRRHQCSGAST